MNWITAAGYIIIAIGTLVGSIIVWYGSTLSTNKDKEEILSKIEETNRKINEVSDSVTTEEGKKEVQQIADDFSNWADSFIVNKEKLKNQYQRSHINLQAKEIELSQKYRPIYEYMLEVLKNYLDAYNAKSKEDIIYDIPQLPSNLYKPEINSYQATIRFNEKSYWKIQLRTSSIVDEEDIPAVYLFVSENEKSDHLLLDREITMRFNIKHDLIHIIKDNVKYKIEGLNKPYTITDYKKSLKEILRILLEYQLSR